MKTSFNPNYKIKKVIDIVSIDHQIHSYRLSAENMGSTLTTWLLENVCKSQKHAAMKSAINMK